MKLTPPVDNCKNTLRPLCLFILFANFVCDFLGFCVCKFPVKPEKNLVHFLLTEPCMYIKLIENYMHHQKCM